MAKPIMGFDLPHLQSPSANTSTAVQGQEITPGGSDVWISHS